MSAGSFLSLGLKQRIMEWGWRQTSLLYLAKFVFQIILIRHRSNPEF
jgi:hypothetical protein